MDDRLVASAPEKPTTSTTKELKPELTDQSQDRKVAEVGQEMALKQETTQSDTIQIGQMGAIVRAHGFGETTPTDLGV